ncbi:MULTISPECIES: TetR/AcrR family transcriptional regulator [Olivibacter]|uniref:TetR/AcrR family transcriptional regulator n=1 Tax=Olivibacter oleidegradans TaxID=760123 RepID=A0ABV6HSY5_9SPHI|nr:TetR/AcrR family transcriptional regulator [Olivibacter jilunii]
MRNRDIEKEQLVKQKAIELIGKGGLDYFSINKLAKECKISVATIYIYYKDKDDLISRLAAEQGETMADDLVRGLDPDAPFEQGLRTQWANRYWQMLNNQTLSLFFEQIRSTLYYNRFMGAFTEKAEPILGAFVQHAVDRGDIPNLPLEVYWSVAFGPLYGLVKFHNDGVSLNGRPFTLKEEMLWQAFELVVKAFKK